MDTRPVNASWRTLATNPTNTTYVLGGRWNDSTLGGVVMVWDTNDPLRRSVPLAGTPLGVPAVFSPDGTRVAVLDRNGDVHQRSTSDGAAIGPAMARGTPAPTNLAFSPDGRHLAARSSRELSLWDTRTGTVEPLVNLSVSDVGGYSSFGNRSNYPIAYRPDGRTLATIRADNRIILVDTTSPDHHQRPLPTSASGIYDVAFSPDGGHLLAATSDGLQQWATSAAPGTPRTMPSPPAASGAPAAAGKPVMRKAIFVTRNLVATTDGHQLFLWDTTTDRIRSLPTPAASTNEVVRLAASPDGAILAVGTSDGQIQRWDVTKASRLDAGLSGGVPLQALLVKADSSTLATTGQVVTTWSANPSDLLERICAITQRGLSAEERSTYGVPLRYAACRR